MIVPYPTPYVLFQLLFPAFIAPTITATRQLFELGFHLGFGFGVYSKQTFAFVYIKGVAEEFNSSYIGHYGFLPIYFQKEFPLDKSCDT